MNILVSGMSFWAFRSFNIVRHMMEFEFELRAQDIEARLTRVIELVRKLGSYGELCMESIIVVGEDQAEMADLQVSRAGGAWEPIPICKENAEAAIKRWGLGEDR